ncbi:MAG: TIGR03668 family PPOX class F420-dependent oxidoreductase [Acidimicrobiia bacterium]
MGDGRLNPRERAGTVRVARLATVGASGVPHLVPVVFALEDDRIVTPIDHKPKRSPRLQRLVNIAAEPRVAVLFDHYDDDWSRLWWVRADGVATVLTPGDPRHQEAAGLLARRYEQYSEHPLDGPIIEIAVTRWSAWAAAN